jgi:hypothetical protein
MYICLYTHVCYLMYIKIFIALWKNQHNMIVCSCVLGSIMSLIMSLSFIRCISLKCFNTENIIVTMCFMTILSLNKETCITPVSKTQSSGSLSESSNERWGRSGRLDEAGMATLTGHLVYVYHSWAHIIEENTLYLSSCYPPCWKKVTCNANSDNSGQPNPGQLDSFFL